MDSINRRNKLIEDNMGLVYMAAKKFIGRGVEFEDIVQIGSVGLLKAGERFDPELNVKFSTYAVTMIIGEIKRYFRDNNSVKIPRGIKEAGYKINKAAECMRKQYNREPTIEELCSYTCMDVEQVVEAIDAMHPCESIYNQNENGTFLFETIADTKDVNLTIEDEIFLREIISSLDARLRQVIVLRFFSDKTQSQVAQILNVSQVQVSRLEKKALSLLKAKAI